MDVEQHRCMMSNTQRKPKVFRAFWIRLMWQWYRAQGWKIEGPFPHHKTPTLLLLGPGLDRNGLWANFVIMRTGHQFLWWTSTIAPGADCHVLCSFDKPQLLATLDWASKSGIQIQLVQRDMRHRKLRCNTPIQPGNHPSRLKDYVVRIFNQ